MNKDKCCGNCAHFKNEDFVSYEIAKKLKEKGFKWDNIATYNSRTKVRNNHTEPTISQVLNWFRNELGFHIVCPFREGEGFYFYIHILGFKEICNSIDRGYYFFKSYEQAALAGIEYVIDNLI